MTSEGATTKTTIPAHYSPVMPYLILSDAEAFIDFIKTVFGAEELLRVNTDDGSVMHCEYSINGGTIMFGQSGGEWTPFPCGMFVVVKDVETCDCDKGKNNVLGVDLHWGILLGFSSAQ